VLTISVLKRWSVSYYTRTADAVRAASMERAAAGGGLGEYYSERDTRIPSWLLVGDVGEVANLTGLGADAVAGGDAETAVVTRWLDDGVAPNGRVGRVFTGGSVHGFDLTFCAPKSVSLLRVMTDATGERCLQEAHNTAIREAMRYLHRHAGYTRVHNPVTGMKDLQRLPGLAAVAYQHETSRAGDPHLHTHVLLPNRQPRADGALVSLDSKSFFHEAKAAGVIYQATLRHEAWRTLGMEWNVPDPYTGMSEVAGVAPELIQAWSRRTTALREWAAGHLYIADDPYLVERAAQKATRPAKPEQLPWEDL